MPNYSMILTIKCYSNTYANDELIRLNKFVSRFTDGFYNLFFINIQTLYVTPPCDTLNLYILLPPFQIIRHSKNLGESKHLKFDQNYRENYKKL
jgi:hypothetical protein